MFIFYRVLEWVRWVFGIVPKSAIGSPKVYYIVYYVLLALTAILLAWFTEDILGGDLFRKFGMQKGLCGILFVLCYAIVRVVLKLVELLGLEEESEFPDIEADWDKILTALHRENLALDHLPLFLVNGLTPHQEKVAFEQASEITWRLIAPPISQENAFY